MSRWTIVLCAALAVVAAGCSSDSKRSESARSPDAPPPSLSYGLFEIAEATRKFGEKLKAWPLPADAGDRPRVQVSVDPGSTDPSAADVLRAHLAETVAKDGRFSVALAAERFVVRCTVRKLGEGNAVTWSLRTVLLDKGVEAVSTVSEFRLSRS